MYTIDIATLDVIFLLLQRLADVMVTKDCFGSQQQWTLLSSTIITVISHECYIEGMIDVDIDVCTL